MFTEEEEWIHSFFKANYKNAYMFAELENMGSDGEVEVCIMGDDHIEIYGKINNADFFENAVKYRESLSEFYSAEIVDQFMDNVTICKKVKETNESYYHVDGVNGRIYVEIVEGQNGDEAGEFMECLTKYIEIDGVMYKDTGIGSSGSAGVFEYSKIVSMTNDEILFTYPLKQDFTDELIFIGIAEGRLVNEDGVWKFGWHLLYDNYTEKYNELWYN